MDAKEKAYCKHDLNVLFGNEVQKVATSQLAKYSFKGTKKELTEYAKQMKDYLLLNKSEYPCDTFSDDGKILYTENLFSTLKNCGFSKIVMWLGDCDGAIAIIGNKLHIGNIIYSDTDGFYFQGRTILDYLEELYGEHTEHFEVAVQLATEEYSTLIDEEERLVRWMRNLGIDVAVNIYSVVEV